MTNICPYLEAVNLLWKHFTSILQRTTIIHLIYSWESPHSSSPAMDSNASEEEGLFWPEIQQIHPVLTSIVCFECTSTTYCSCIVPYVTATLPCFRNFPFPTSESNPWMLCIIIVYMKDELLLMLYFSFLSSTCFYLSQCVTAPVPEAKWPLRVDLSGPSTERHQGMTFQDLWLFLSPWRTGTITQPLSRLIGFWVIFTPALDTLLVFGMKFLQNPQPLLCTVHSLKKKKSVFCCDYQHSKRVSRLFCTQK